MASHDWEAEAQIYRDILDRSIPKQWLLPENKLPAPEQTNVLNVPEQSGILKESQLHITWTDATGLVEAMAKGTRTAEEITVGSAQDEAEYKAYAPENFAETPIGLQLVGNQFCDKETVAAVKILEEVIRS